MPEARASNLLLQVGAIIVALLLTTLVLLAAKAPPLAAYVNIALGAVGSWDVAANVLVSWVPLLLATSGLLITFTAGLWNIGIEGQITLGAIFTTWVLRGLQGIGCPPAVIIALSIVAGMAGGALWALLAGALKTFGGVNEIFGGLGLNFVAAALNLWLIFGPWKRPGVASMSGTVPFAPSLWLPTLSAQSRLSPAAVLLAVRRHRARLHAAAGNPFRAAPEGGRKEPQRRLPAGSADLAAHDDVLRLVRCIRGPRRCCPGHLRSTTGSSRPSPAGTATSGSWWRCWQDSGRPSRLPWRCFLPP